MKTLADLKRQASNYTLEMYFNSWATKDGFLPVGHKLYGLRREVGKLQTNRMAFKSPTDSGLSWLEFPKASELTITDNVICGGQLKTKPHGEYIVTIKPMDEKGCELRYHLRPLEVLQAV